MLKECFVATNADNPQLLTSKSLKANSYAESEFILAWNRPKIKRAVVGQRSSPAGYILYCNIFIIKKTKMK